MSTKSKVGVPVISELHLPNGGWLDYWTKNAAVVKQFVVANKLNPATVTAGGAALAARGAKAAKDVRFIDLGIRGGIRLAHLHLNNDVFLLDDAQWATFSAKVMKTTRAAIASAKSIGFENAMNIQSALQKIG